MELSSVQMRLASKTRQEGEEPAAYKVVWEGLERSA